MRIFLTITVVAALAFGIARFFNRPEPPRSPDGSPLLQVPEENAAEGTVAEVVDGDSVVLADGRSVRYLGIDCPEAGLPDAENARKSNRRLVQGKKVRLRFDGTRRKDGYGRLLALVFLPSTRPRQRERCVNVELVRQGLAWTYFHDSAEMERIPLQPLIEAQREALRHGRGLWRAWLSRRDHLDELVSTAVRIHRRGCSKIGENAPQDVTSLVEELRAGKSPCRACRPLERK